MNIKILMGLLIVLLATSHCSAGDPKLEKIYTVVSANDTIPEYRLITRLADWYAFVDKHDDKQAKPHIDFGDSMVIIYAMDAANPNKANFRIEVDKDGVANLKTYITRVGFTPSEETKMICLRVPRRGIKYYAHEVKKGDIKYTRRDDIFSAHQIKGSLTIPKEFQPSNGGHLSMTVKLFRASILPEKEAQEIDRRIKNITHKPGHQTKVNFSLANHFVRPLDDPNKYFVRCELLEGQTLHVVNEAKKPPGLPGSVYEGVNGQDVTFEMKIKRP